MKSLAQIAYEHDVAYRPYYEGGEPRVPWDILSPLAQSTWEANPRPRWGRGAKCAYDLWNLWDHEWSFQLEIAFGNDAGNQRYRRPGQGEPFSPLWVAHLGFVYFGKLFVRECAL